MDDQKGKACTYSEGRSCTKENEIQLLRKLPVEEQIEYLLDKVQALEDVIFNYSKIIKIAQRKTNEFSIEAILAIKSQNAN
jgi:hypothetical protein